MKVINNFNKPLALDDGTVLAAAGTEGCEREVKKLSDRDKRRFADTGRIAIIEEPKAALSRKKEDN